MGALFDAVERRFGGIDVVVHFAGVMPMGSLIDLDLAKVDEVLRVNVRGTFVVDQQAARHLRSGGALVNVSSSVTRFATPGYLAYTASRGAVQAMTLARARELRGRDITVNAVAPGAIETEMLAAYPDGDSGQARAEIAARSPLERVGIHEDIAEVVAFLAGPGRWVNGQVIFANGGAL
jgi:3-oxoacyl-[acyl-carrier protein] reductase